MRSEGERQGTAALTFLPRRSQRACRIIPHQIDPMNLPRRLTLHWLLKHADHRLVGPESRWSLTAWNNVVFLKLSHAWSPEQANEYMNYLPGISSMVRETKDRIFLVFDTTDMELRKEDVHLYFSSNWLALLDQESLKVCIVDESQARRKLWLTMYMVVGRQYYVEIFASADEALAWVGDELAAAALRDD